MTAYLDTVRNYGDRTGGVSDPRLVSLVDRIHPTPNTADEIAAARRHVHRRSTGPRDLATLIHMIFPPLQEAA